MTKTLIICRTITGFCYYAKYNIARYWDNDSQVNLLLTDAPASDKAFVNWLFADSFKSYCKEANKDEADFDYLVNANGSAKARNADLVTIWDNFKSDIEITKVINLSDYSEIMIDISLMGDEINKEPDAPWAALKIYKKLKESGIPVKLVTFDYRSKAIIDKFNEHYAKIYSDVTPSVTALNDNFGDN